MKPLTWAYKFSREIARRMAHFRGEPAIAHPAFAPGGPASVIAYAEGPVASDAPRIVYSEGDELVLEEYVRTRGSSSFDFYLFKSRHWKLIYMFSMSLSDRSRAFGEPSIFLSSTSPRISFVARVYVRVAVYTC